MSENGVTKFRVTEIRASEIRISSNHRKLHGAIFVSRKKVPLTNLTMRSTLEYVKGAFFVL